MFAGNVIFYNVRIKLFQENRSQKICMSNSLLQQMEKYKK